VRVHLKQAQVLHYHSNCKVLATTEFRGGR
jgi:hypothetical protein